MRLELANAAKMRIEEKLDEEQYADMVAAAQLTLQTKLAREYRKAQNHEIYTDHAISEITERLNCELDTVNIKLDSLWDQRG